jgi:hypothetical protein
MSLPDPSMKLYLTHTVSTLRELEFNGPVLHIDNPLVLGCILSELVDPGYGKIPALMAHAIRVPMEDFSFYDLYICFDPTNYSEPEARYHLVRPIRKTSKVDICDINFSPRRSNTDVSSQLDKIK